MSVTLSQTAPWSDGRSPALRNGYRTRFTEVNGRYFKVSADSLDAPWWIEEINADGSLKGDLERFTDERSVWHVRWVGGFSEIVFTLAEARAVIGAEAR